MEADSNDKPGFLAALLNRIPERTIGMRTTAVFETVLFLGVLTALNYLFSDGSRFIDFAPHPYWIIILLIATQYGTNEALTAAILASVLLLAWNLPEQAMDESTFDYIFKISFRPLLWIVAAVVIGELRVHHIQQMQGLQRDFAETEKREKSITRAYEQLRNVKEGLEARIAGHLQGTVALHQSLKSIEGLSPVQILMGVGEMVANVINPEKFSVYSFGPNGFEVISSLGWTEEDGFSRRITSDSKLYQEVMKRRRVICSINQQDADILEDEGILVGPLIDPQGGEIFGMLKIETLDFIDLTLTNVETFKILCEWAGSAYAQARQFQETLADTMHNPDTGAMSQQFGQFARQILETMKTEHGVKTTTIDIALSPARRQNARDRIATARRFFKLVQDPLPANAMICDGRRRNMEFVIFIPGAGPRKGKSILSTLDQWRNSNRDDLLQTVEMTFELKSI
ncbi:GAF domain-containing protein [bacterium]|nr:GAF domain-containing protein [bacterium]